MPTGDLIEHRCFELAKARLPLAGKHLRDAAPGHLLDAAVGIEKAIAQELRQVPAGGALAAAHHSHQIEVEALEALAQLSVRVGHGCSGSAAVHIPRMRLSSLQI